jgi:peroxiredoxin Q/BCP
MAATKKSATPGKKSARPEARGSSAPRTTLEIGSRAPDFTLPSSDGRDVSLAALRGKHVVVYFYPKDDTPGCTREAQGFRDAKRELAKRGAIVVGVSKDSIESHCRFRDKYELDFPLLSDRDGTTIAAYGAWGEKNMYGKKSMGIVRSTVVIAPDGTVKKVFPRVKVEAHVREVLDAIDA